MLDNVIIFDARIAEKYSLEEAIVIANIYGWLKHNATNNMNYHDGRYWTYNSLTAFAKQFPFWSESKVKRILIDLAGGTDKKDVKPKHEPLIMKQNFNKSPFDRTVWYSFTDKFFMYLKELGYETYSDFPQKEIPFSADDQMDIPPADDHIPPSDKQYQEYNNTINNTNNNTNNITSTIVDVPQGGGEGKEEEILDAEIVEEAQEKERGISEAEAPESVNEVPQKGKRKKDGEPKVYSLQYRCQTYFLQEYEKYKGTSYRFNKVDAANLKGIIDGLKYMQKQEQQPYDDDSIEVAFQIFINSLICIKPDNWIDANFSLPVINSKFNIIYAQLKNGTTRQQQRRGPTDEFIRRTWEELQANGGLAF